MTILAIDTTGEQLHVAVKKDDGAVKALTAPGRPHSKTLLPLIKRLIGKKKPDAIAVATGPGSYTGTRVGVTTANLLGWTWKIPVYGIPSHEAETVEELLGQAIERNERNEKSDRALPVYPTIVG